MSHVNGIGYGSSHNWENRGSLQWGSMGLPSTAARTDYNCKDCGVRFVHQYNITPNIFKAIEEAGVPDICTGQENTDV